MANMWIEFLYQYLVGGIIFAFGLYLCWKNGDTGFKTKKQRLNTFLLVGGFAFYLVAHGVWTALAAS